ncbi:MAG: hypothetical protein CV045_14320 [Cyanobacteria bacterium M5B4]|nr:MAG: hypothetical protein CV045_14320 [Cyanobacteria bacterium M5B4]
MDIEQAILEQIRRLPPSEQHEVLNFAAFLHYRRSVSPYRGVKGLWTDIDAQVSAEEIDAARRELWGSFPREDIA